MSASTLHTKVLYGLKTNVIGNAHFITDSDVLYPVGNALAIHNFAQQRQRLLPLSDKQNINIIAISPNKKYVALCEMGEKPTISLYDIHTMKRKKILVIPYETSDVTEFSCISFSFDNRYLAAITGEPDQTMLYYLWEKGKVESSIKLNNLQSHSSIINLIACNPGDVGIISIAGYSYFKLLTVFETVWRPYGFSKADNLLISSIVWLNTDRLFAGTQDGRILFIENGDLKNIYNITKTTVMNLKMRDEINNQPRVMIPSNNVDGDEIYDNSINCLTSFPKGFAFGCGAKRIIVFERDGQHKYLKRHTFVVPTQISSESTPNLYNINSISINLSYNCLLVTTGWPQLFHTKIFDVDTSLESDTLKIMGHSSHNGPIGGISMCTWKSIFMTYGVTDRSVRIWDYETESLIMIKQYMEDIFSISLHPIGLFCLIGFSDKLRFLTILIDNLLQMEEFAIRNCQTVEFSHGGHLFGAVNGNIVQIYTTVEFHNCFSLKGHTGKIKKLIWSQNDMKLITIGSEGTIYVWDMSNGVRITEIILKNVSLESAAVTSDGMTIYCIVNNDKIYEIRDDVILREINIENAMMRLFLMDKIDYSAFVSTSTGAIMSFKYPFQEPYDFENYHIHCANITCLTMSFHGEIILSSDENGTLCIWRIVTKEKSLNLYKNTYTNEILISKIDLEDKICLIRELNLRINELETEQAYKIRQIEVIHNEKMRQAHFVYCESIEELKSRIEKLQEDRTNELNNMNVEIVKLKKKHEKIMQDIIMNYDTKLINEYDKFTDLEQSHRAMKMDYERQLMEVLTTNKNELEKNIKIFTGEIYGKNAKLEECAEEMASQARLHEKIKDQIEVDADREIVEIRSEYESKLYEEQKINLKLMGETGVLRNRYAARQKTIDEFKQQIYQLKNERKQYQKTIQDLERDILDLKNEITERDTTIQDKEKSVHDLERNNQELEKYKFVLNYKIRESKKQIEPRDDEIKMLKAKINDIEIELINLQKTNVALELQLNENREKMLGAKREINIVKKKNRHTETMLKRIRTELANAITVIDNPMAMKAIMKNLYQRYSANEEFLRNRGADLEAQREFTYQRAQLEKTVEALKKHIHRDTSLNYKRNMNKSTFHDADDIQKS